MEKIIQRVLCEEIERLTWQIEYQKGRAEKAEAELQEVKKKLEDLTF